MFHKLNKEEIKRITNEFYSHFCSTDISKLTQGTHFICSKDRDEELQCFGCKYTIFVLIKDDLCIVAYSPKYSNFIDKIRECSANEIINEANQNFKLNKMQLMIFNDEIVNQYGNARILKEKDYPLYETFFRTAIPDANPEGWLYEYFSEKAAKEYFTGCIIDDKLMSVCDAPDMPYMQGIIQHTGIRTLKEEQRKGYAQSATALATHHLIERGICPQWECDADNIASIELAQSIGYKKYGVAYILEE